LQADAAGRYNGQMHPQKMSGVGTLPHTAFLCFYHNRLFFESQHGQ